MLDRCILICRKKNKKHTFHTYFFNDERPHMYRTLNKFSFIEIKYTIKEDVIEIFFRINTDKQQSENREKMNERNI
jgi:hypothetical protein